MTADICGIFVCFVPARFFTQQPPTMLKRMCISHATWMRPRTVCFGFVFSYKSSIDKYVRLDHILISFCILYLVQDSF